MSSDMSQRKDRRSMSSDIAQRKLRVHYSQLTILHETTDKDRKGRNGKRVKGYW